MSFCLKQVRIFWMLAVLLMAGGQALHAHADMAKAAEHASCSHDAKADDCRTDASCCHMHVSGATVTPGAAAVACTQTLSHSLPIVDESYLDGPRGDIDYPPQLS